MRAWLAELYRRDRVLALAGAAHLAALGPALVAMLVDERSILGLDPWVKPARFLVSGAVYLWTLAWLMPSVTGPRWAKALVSGGAAAVMVVENVCIALQSARGVRSHFNFDTPFDGSVFGFMGLAIAFNSLLVALFLALTFLRPAARPRAWLWGLRLGALGFLLAGAQGFAMVAHGAHTVGLADGGPGLPFVNWSTAGGDLRISHAVGLHALQALPLCAWLAGRAAPRASERARTAAVVLFGLAWIGLGAWLELRAGAGLPLVQLR